MASQIIYISDRGLFGLIITDPYYLCKKRQGYLQNLCTRVSVTFTFTLGLRRESLFLDYFEGVSTTHLQHVY